MGGYSVVHFVVTASTNRLHWWNWRIDESTNRSNRRIDEPTSRSNGRLDASTNRSNRWTDWIDEWTNRGIDRIERGDESIRSTHRRIDRIDKKCESTESAHRSNRRVDESTNGMNWSCLIFLDCPINCFQNKWIQRHKIDTNRYSPRIPGRFVADGAKNRYAIKNSYG